jgi:hypothetical protein
MSYASTLISTESVVVISQVDVLGLALEVKVGW